MPTPKQIKIIHVLKGVLKMNETAYRQLLINFSGVVSSKDLHTDEAARLIDYMEQMAIRAGIWQKFSQKKKYDELGDRPYMASPTQLRMIEAMWRDVSVYQRDAKKRAAALDAFCKRIVGANGLLDVEAWQVEKIVKAMKEMARWRDSAAGIREEAKGNRR